MRICVIDADHVGGAAHRSLAPGVEGVEVHVVCLAATVATTEPGVILHPLPLEVPALTDLHLDRWIDVSATIYDRFQRLHHVLRFDVVEIDADDLAGLHVAQHRPLPLVCRTSTMGSAAPHMAQTEELRRHVLRRADALVGADDDTRSWLRTIRRSEQVVIDSDPPLSGHHAALDADRKQVELDRGVVQVMEALDVGDGVSDIVRRNAEILGQLGQSTHILGLYADPAVHHLQRPLHTGLDATGLIFHMWGTHGSSWLLDAAECRKAIYFHNITPPEFFADDDAQRGLMVRGLQQLAQRADTFDLAMAVSQFDLDDFMVHRTRPVASVVVPPVIDPDSLWRAPFDDVLLQAIRHRGGLNIVFVGRLVPNKRQDRLVELFDLYWREINPDATLWLIGSEPDRAYSATVHRRIERSVARERIVVTGRVSERALWSYFRAADVYVSASEHEGFGIPLVQAMAFDTPVLALGRAAVAETMGPSGILLDEWDPQRVAMLLEEVAYDHDLRRAMVAEQRHNVERFSSAVVTARLAAAVRYLRDGEDGPPLRWLVPDRVTDADTVPA